MTCARPTKLHGDLPLLERVATFLALVASLMTVTSSLTSAQAEESRYVVRIRDVKAQYSAAALMGVPETLGIGKAVAAIPRDNSLILALSEGQRALVEQHVDVTGVERDKKVHAFFSPNDPRYSEQYSLNSTVGIDAPDAWDRTIGSPSALVAVVDSGVDYIHEDLQTSIWTNPGEIAGNGVDDDSNGFVDDVHGYDFANEDGEPLDDNGHGTHVAGTIAAAGNNSVGMIGVAWGAQVIAIKCLDSAGSGFSSDLVRAIDYAITLKGQGYPIVAINLSLGGEYTSSLERAVSRAADRGILIVAAAGNEGSNDDSSPTYPASLNLPNILSVAATNSSGELADYSNYGRSSVDVGAPGSGILSTLPRQGGVSRYGYESGTSMATPHVSGIAALVVAANLSASATLTRSIIMSTTRANISLAGRTATGGMVDAFGAVLKAQGQEAFKLSGVVKRNGRGLSRVTMIVKSKGGATTSRRTTRTDRNGKYALSNLPIGSYTVQPRYTGLRFSPRVATVDILKNTRKNFTVSQ